MTYRDFMNQNEENLGCCKPVSYDYGSVVVEVCDGHIEAIQIDGVNIDVTPDSIRDVSARIKELEDMGDDGEELPCRLCPWFDSCYAMDDIMPRKDIMSRNDENMDMCMPVSYDNGRVVVMVVDHGYIEGIQIDGVDIYPTPDAVRDVSARIKELEDMGDDGEELPCRLCPWFYICDQMLEEFEPNPDEY